MPLNLLVFQLGTSVVAMATAKRRVEVITNARRSPLEGWRHRRRLYATLQLARIPLLVLSGVVMWLTHNAFAGVGLAVLSVPLPWIAVLLANETGESDETTNNVYKPALVRENRRVVRAALDNGAAGAFGALPTASGASPENYGAQPGVPGTLPGSGRLHRREEEPDTSLPESQRAEDSDPQIIDISADDVTEDDTPPHRTQDRTSRP